jgi:hypothetical protein
MGWSVAPSILEVVAVAMFAAHVAKTGEQGTHRAVWMSFDSAQSVAPYYHSLAHTFLTIYFLLV